MIRRQDRVYFRCRSCGALCPMTVNLADYDAAEYECDHCGEGTWVDLDTVLTSKGERYVSSRPIGDDAEYDTLGDVE